jgi:hypothetical protein
MCELQAFLRRYRPAAPKLEVALAAGATAGCAPFERGEVSP